jgi:hypothetical protein
MPRRLAELPAAGGDEVVEMARLLRAARGVGHSSLRSAPALVAAVIHLGARLSARRLSLYAPV